MKRPILSREAFALFCVFLPVWYAIFWHGCRLDRAESRLAATERRLNALRPVQVQTMNIHVERPQDAPKVAEGLMRSLPGFAPVKRLATAKDLR